MSYPLVRECIAPGVYFSAITDKKFKHNRMSVNLIAKLDRQKVTGRAVVPFILRQGSKNCPDFTQLNKRLCDLYGASLGAGVDKFGEYQIIALGMIGVDSRFTLQGEDMVRACAGLLAEILLEPNITDGKFDKKNTELEKQNLLDTIQAEINDKRTYAWIRCRDVMCQGEGCAIKKYGYKEDAEKITPESAAAAYEELIRTARIEIMFEGCGDPSAAKEIFREKFAGMRREPIEVSPNCARNQQGPVKQETRTDGGQAGQAGDGLPGGADRQLPQGQHRPHRGGAVWRDGQIRCCLKMCAKSSACAITVPPPTTASPG